VSHPGQDISKQPWTTFETRSYFVWNHVAKRIEMISVDTWAGAVHVSEVKSEGGGVFSSLQVSSTLSGKEKENMVVTVTQVSMTTIRLLVSRCASPFRTEFDVTSYSSSTGELRAGRKTSAPTSSGQLSDQGRFGLSAQS
jgi:hypothetical protein